MNCVGIDARSTRQMSAGMKAYVRELVARLPRVAPDLRFVTFGRGENFGWEEQIALPAAIRRARVDLAHFTSLYMPLAAPRPYVLTVHDLIHLRFPQYFKRKVGVYYRTAVRLGCARAARIVTDDERTVADLERFLGVDPAKVRVVALGAGEEFLTPPPAFAAPRPYLIYAGNHRRHKDLPTLFEAWSTLPPEHAIDLYLTGQDDFGGALAAYRRNLGEIRVLGDAPGEKLAAYFAGATALVHPALGEGFGLPMLEAMAAGCPVVACADALPRVLQPAALTFPARDAAALRGVLARLLGDEGRRAVLVNEGRILARRLTWDRCATATAAVYREVLEERRA
ncbi:MAG: glycosyltransferase family 4 protein [Vulcanimicrobiaceae bacterium]